jgi:hypothetical protein
MILDGRYDRAHTTLDRQPAYILAASPGFSTHTQCREA